MNRKTIIATLLAAALALLLLDVFSWLVPLEWGCAIGARDFIDVQIYKGGARLRHGTHFLQDPRRTRSGTDEEIGLGQILTFRTSVTVRNPSYLDPPPANTKWHRRIGRLRLRLWAPAALLCIYPTAAIMYGAHRRRRRRLRRECTRCGYNLSGNTTGVCSECGQAFEGE